jgi:hypothetical protein
MRTIGTSLLAALGALLGLAFAAPAAQAQICGDIGECDISDDVYDDNIQEFCGFFPLDEDSCGKMAQRILQQCETAVKNALKCWNAYTNGFPKTAKTPCKEAAKNPSDCNEDFKDQANGWEDDNQADAEYELDCCLDMAEDFFDDCQELCL